jgi:hypothetical protein
MENTVLADTYLQLGRYAAGEDILQLSANVDFPPCLLLRRVLEELLQLGKQVATPDPCQAF